MSKFENLKLHYQEDNCALTTEEDGTITLCFTNTGDTAIVFSKVDAIYFYYDYSDDEQSLTSDANSISVSSNNDQFSVAVDKSTVDKPPTVPKYFMIFAKNSDATIPANGTITFSVTATCSKTPGKAVTIFKYSDDEEEHPDRKCFGINKYRKPVITMFKIDGAGYNEGDLVTLIWTVNHIEEYNVRLDNIPVSTGQTSYNLKIACCDYTLYVMNKAGYVSSKPLSPDFGVKLEQVIFEKKNAVKLKWDASRLRNSEVKISRNDTGETMPLLNKFGTVVFDNITDDVDFDLVYNSYYKRISVTCPKIISFEVSRTPFTSSREFTPPEEVVKSKYRVTGSYYDVGPNPKPTPPTEYTVYLKWEICGDYCWFNGVTSRNSRGKDSYKSTNNSVEFRAYTDHKLFVSQTKYI